MAWRAVDYDPFAAAPPADEEPAAAPAPADELPAAPAVASPPKPAGSLYEPPNPEPAAAPAAATPAKGTWKPVDYNPFTKGSYIPEISKGVAKGAVDTTATTLKGVSENLEMARRAPVQWKKDVLGIFDQIDQGNEDLSQAVDAELFHFGETYRDMDPAQRAEFKKGMQDNLAIGEKLTPYQDITQGGLYQFAQDMQDWSDEEFRAAADFEGGWTRKISEGLGSLGPTIAASILTRGSNLGVGAVGYAMSTGELVDKALQAGASPEQVMQVITQSGVPGLTEQIPIETLLEKLPIGQWGRAMTILGKAGSQVLVEGGQEVLQSWMGNIINKYTYNPDQDLSEGLLEAGIVGGAVGGIAGGVTAPFTVRAPKALVSPDAAEEELAWSSPGVEEAKQDENKETGTPLPEGVVAPDPAAQGDKDTPGDTAAKDPQQPVGTPPVKTEEAGKEALAAKEAAPAVAKVTPEGTVAPEIQAAADAAKPAKVLTPEQQAEVERKAAERKAAIAGLGLPDTEVAPDVAAALNPDQPTLNTPAPEPVGTPQAAERRAQPQDPGTPPTADPAAAPVAPTAEPVSDTKAQVDAIRDPSSGKDAALITPDSSREGVDLAGLETVETAGGLFVTSNPEKAEAARQLGAVVTDEQMAELLGYTTPKSESDGTVVQARDAVGNVVQEEATNAAAAPVAAEAAAEAAPAGGDVVATNALDVQERRAAPEIDAEGQARLAFLRKLAEADGYVWDDVLQMDIEESRQLLAELEEQYKAGELVIEGEEPAAAAAPVPAEQPVIPELDVTPAPDWSIENDKAAVALAEKLGLIDTIREQAEKGVVAKDISDNIRAATGTEFDPNQVRAVRNSLGIEPVGPTGFAGVALPEDVQRRDVTGTGLEPDAQDLPAENPVIPDETRNAAVMELRDALQAAEFKGKPQEPVLPEVAVEARPLERTPPVKPAEAAAPKPKAEVAVAAPAPRVGGTLSIKRAAPSVEDVKSKRGVTVVREVPKPTAVSVEGGDTARPTNVTLLLTDAIRDRLKKSDVTEHEDYEDTLKKVASELTAKVRKGAPPVAESKRLLDEAAATVKQRIEQKVKDKAVIEAADAEIAHAKAKQKATGNEKGSSITGKEKPAEAVKTESEDTIKEKIAAEMTKPEGERHPKRVRQGELFEERKKLKGGGAEKLTEEQREEGHTTRKEKRQKLTEEIYTLQDEIAAEAAERQRAAEAAKPKPEAVVAPDKNATLKSAIDAVEEPEWGNVREKDLRQTTLDYMRKLVDAARAAITAAGETMGSDTNVKLHSPEENLAIFANKQLALEAKGEKMTPDAMAKFLTGRLLLKSGDVADFNKLFASEISKGSGTKADNLEDTTGLVRTQRDKAAVAAAAKSGRFYDAKRTDQPTPDPKPKLNESGEIDPNDFSKPVDQRDTVTMRNDAGKEVTVRPHSVHRVKDVVSVVTAQSRSWLTSKRGGLYDIIRRMHAKVLRSIVGDVNIVFLSREDFDKVRSDKEAVASYYSVHPVHLAVRGDKPFIIVDHDHWKGLSKARQEHLIMHEATHAATLHAYHSNLHGVRSLVDQMRETLEQDLKATGKWDILTARQKYGFKDGGEFIAEAFSNEEFQKLLTQHRITPSMSIRQRKTIQSGKPRDTVWKQFTRAVSRALGMANLFGLRGQTYMEAIVAVYPELIMSSDEQLQHARDYVARFGPDMDEEETGKPAGPPKGPTDVANITASVMQAVDEKKKGLVNVAGRSARTFRQKTGTTKEILRRSVAIWGGPNNPLVKLGVAGLKAANRLRKAARKGQDILMDLADAKRRHARAFEKLADILHRATLGQYNPMEVIGHASNKHIKNGDLDAHTRAEHAKDYAEFRALPKAVRDSARDWVEHLRDQETTRVTRLVRNIIRQAIDQFGLKLPAGETEASVMKWVLDGDVDRRAPADPANIQPNERTQRDQDLHDALGNTAKTLKGSKEMHVVKGLYVPLMRRGDRFFSAEHKVTAVPGSSLMADGQTLVFHDKKTWQDYVKTAHTHDDRQIQNRPWIEHLDPATGANVGAKDARGRPFYFIKIQNKAMETSDNEIELAELRKEYEKNGFTTSAIGHVEKDLHADSALMPAQLSRVIRNMQQSSTSPSATKANVGAVVDAYIRQMSGNRAAHRRIKRKGIKGYSKDLLRNSYEANFAISRHVENLDIIPELAKLENEAIDYMRQAAKNNVGKEAEFDNLEREAQFKEIIGRINGSSEASSWGVTKLLLDASFIYRLFTPAYTVANILGGVTNGFAVLGEKHSPQAVMGSMTRAMGKLGAKDLSVTAMYSFAKEIANTAVGGSMKAFDFHEDFIQKQLKTGTLERRFADELEDQGLGVASGLETSDLTDINAGRTRKVLDRTMRMSRVFPAAAETLNRYITGLAALELAKGRGMSDEEAIAWAIDQVERSQGGYGVENNPGYFNKPVLRVTLQFKKYAQMYGQLYYGAVMGMLGQSSHQTKLEAARTFGYLTGFNILMAGVYGIAPMEIFRIMGIFAQALGKDDWEDWENWMQGMLQDAISKTPAEMLTHGFSRAFGVDMSNRLGNENLLAFGEPRSAKESDVKAWGFDLLTGAVGGMISDKVKALSSGDFVGAIPLPKFMTDAIAGYTSTQQGPTSDMGREYADPLGLKDAIVKSMGFRPATEARRFEYGGSSTKHFAEQKTKAQRTRVMQEYANAAPRDRRKVWDTSIRQWNKDHPKDRIDMGNLQRSLNTRKQQKKLRDKERADAED